MTTEEMQQKSSETRKAAKALQQKLQTVIDPNERKVLARQMNELYAQAASLRNKAKQRHYQEESIEREFLSMKANMEED